MVVRSVIRLIFMEFKDDNAVVPVWCCSTQERYMVSKFSGEGPT